MPQAREDRETWEDWQAPGAPEVRQISRAELLAELEAYNVQPPVKASDLRYWEYLGILPAPVRKKHNGVVSGVYPIWIVTLVVELRYLQKAHVQLKDMREPLREEAWRISKPERPNRLTIAGLPPAPRIPDRYPLPPDLLTQFGPEQRERVFQCIDALLTSILEPHEEDPTNPLVILEAKSSPRIAAIVRAELTITDVNGNRTLIDLPLDIELP